MLNHRETDKTKLLDDFLLHFEGYADLDSKVDYAIDLLIDNLINMGYTIKEGYPILQMLHFCKYIARIRYLEREVESPTLRDRVN